MAVAVYVFSFAATRTARINNNNYAHKFIYKFNSNNK